MKSASQQAAVEQYAEEIPSRPESFVPGHLSEAYEAVFPNIAGANKQDVGFREELAAAFRRLGNGVSAPDAFARAKDFHRSSGHAWTHGLSR